MTPTKRALTRARQLIYQHWAELEAVGGDPCRGGARIPAGEGTN